MDKKVIAPILVVLLSIAFVVVCFLIYFSGKRKAKFINIKIKLGAIILSMQTLTSCYSYYLGSCYRATQENFYLNSIVANAGITQKTENYSFNKISTYNFGADYLIFRSKFTHIFNERREFSYYGGFYLKKYTANSTDQKIFIGNKIGITYLPKFVNFFTDFDFSADPRYLNPKNYTLGANLGIKTNNFFLSHYTSGRTNFGIDLYLRYEFITQMPETKPGFFLGARFYIYTFTFRGKSHKVYIRGFE